MSYLMCCFGRLVFGAEIYVCVSCVKKLVEISETFNFIYLFTFTAHANKIKAISSNNQSRVQKGHKKDRVENNGPFNLLYILKAIKSPKRDKPKKERSLTFIIMY